MCFGKRTFRRDFAQTRQALVTRLRFAALEFGWIGEAEPEANPAPKPEVADGCDCD